MRYILKQCGLLIACSILLTSCGIYKDALLEKRGETEDGYTIFEAEDAEVRSPKAPKEQIVTLESIAEEIETDEATAPVEQEIPTEKKIVLSAVGDVTLCSYEEQGYSGTFDEAYDINGGDYFFSNVKDFFSDDDITVINLEGNLTDSEERNPGRDYYLRGRQEYASILPKAGIDVVTLANNHRNDFFEEGAKDTRDALDAVDMPYAYDNKVVLYEAGDVSVGVVAINCLGLKDYAKKLIDSAASQFEERPDILVAALHWGIEREFYPDEDQINIGHYCIDQGFDLVIGCHPHVLQSIEEYEGRHIVYSMGNFCFGANRNPVDKDSIIYREEFIFDDDKNLSETKGYVIPCSVSSVKERNDFRPTPAEGEDYNRIIERLNTYSNVYDTIIDDNGIVTSR